jgi:hypothetical protein
MSSGKWLPTFRRNVVSSSPSSSPKQRVLLLALLELLDPEEEGVTLFRNVGSYLPVVTAKYVRRSDLQSSKWVGEY